MSIGTGIEQAYGIAAPICGEMSLAIVVRKTTLTQLDVWARQFKEVSRVLENTLEQETKKRE